MKDIQAQFHVLEEVWLEFSYQEVNMIANTLAKYGRNHAYIYKKLDDFDFIILWSGLWKYGLRHILQAPYT